MFDRHIAFQARQQPRASAIVTQRGDISFAQFADEIAAVARWAQALRLERARVVVVRIADRYLHWLALLALARLGVPSASVAETAPAADVQRFSPQALITDRDDLTATLSTVCPVAEFTVAEARQAIASDNRLWRGEPVDPNTLARVNSSSGTTGEPKLIGLSWSQVDLRLTSFLRAAPQVMSRVLALVGPEIGGFEVGLCAWSIGGALVLGPRTPDETAEALPQLAPAALAGAPIQLQIVVRALPEGSLPLPSMRVALFGAQTPTDVRREISLRLSSDVHNLYGSTEGGVVAWSAVSRLAEATAVGFVPPWVDLEIVDEEDQPCPPDVAGVLRVRGPVVANGYLDDPVASREHFRNGWFYAGDTGLLTAGGLLHLHGRTNEVVNLGGNKVLPLVIEEAALSCPAVTDAAAFMAPGKDGVEALWVAVVSSATVDRAQLFDRLLNAGAASASLVFVREIPRNPRGKILRDALRRTVIASAAKQ